MSSIENIEKLIKEKQADYDSYEEEIQRIQQELIANDLYSTKTDILLTSVEQQVEDYTNTIKKSCNPYLTAEQKAPLQAIITSISTDFPALRKLDQPVTSQMAINEEIISLNADLDEAKLAQKAPKDQEISEKKEEQKQETQAEVEQEGHVYPVKMVSAWTAKLKQYNTQMDDFIKQIDALSVDVDLTWLCKKIESFCRKINYALAMVRAEIIKGLSGMYKQAQKFTSLIDPIVNFNPADIFACLGWVKNVISFFTKPYTTIIQFITDFMTYTPPLVSEAVTLVGKAASVPAHLLGTIDLVAEGKDGEKKEFADAVKEYISIKMEPITIGDVLGGSVEEPKLEESQIDKVSEELHQKEVDNAVAEVDQAIQALRNYILNTPYSAEDDLYVTYPHKINKIADGGNYISTSETAVSTNPDYAFLTPDQVADKIFPNQRGKKDVMNTTFNTIRHKYYGVCNAAGLQEYAKSDDAFGTISDNIQTYYVLQYMGATTRSQKTALAYQQKEMDFLLKFANVFPLLPQYLQDIKTAVYLWELATI